MATAPLLGGAIIQGIGWHWIFWINVPIGVVSAVASAAVLEESRVRACGWIWSDCR